MNPLLAPPPQRKIPKTIAVVLWLIGFFPVGLWLVWTHPAWTLKTKQYWSAGWVAFALIGLIYNASPAGQADRIAQAKADASVQAQQQANQVAQAKAEQSKKVAQAKADVLDEAAARKESVRQDALTARSLARMQHDFLRPPNSDLVKAVEEGDDPYEVRVTVTNDWFLRLHQIRLQSAQNIWAEWAQLRSPDNPGRAYIDIVDVNGNHVGGSSVDDGTAVKVDD